MHYFPLWWGWWGNRRGLLVFNHEYTDANQIYSAVQGSAITPDDAGRKKVAKALAAHGVTVVDRPSPFGHRGDPQTRRQKDRHLTDGPRQLCGVGFGRREQPVHALRSPLRTENPKCSCSPHHGARKVQGSVRRQRDWRCRS